MEERLIAELVEFVEAASPDLWAVVRQQVWVMVIRGVYVGILSWLLMLVAVYSYAYCKRRASREDRWDTESEWNAWSTRMVASLVVAALFGGILLLSLAEIIGPIMNPDYYAIQVLMALAAK